MVGWDFGIESSDCEGMTKNRKLIETERLLWLVLWLLDTYPRYNLINFMIAFWLNTLAKPTLLEPAMSGLDTL